MPDTDKIILSYHTGHAVLDHFIDVVKILAGNLQLHVNVLMDNELFDYCLAAAKENFNIGEHIG